MRRIGALVAIAVACGAAGASAARGPVLAVEWRDRGSASLVWVDPLSLRPVAGGRLVTGQGVWPYARSPGGRYLLTGSATATDVALRIVDLSTRRSSPVLRVPGATGAHAVWSARDRIDLVAFANGRAVERLVLAPRPLRSSRVRRSRERSSPAPGQALASSCCSLPPAASGRSASQSWAGTRSAPPSSTG
jgi:hypothetical protein